MCRNSEFSPQPAPAKGRRRRAARPLEALLVRALRDAGYADTAIARALRWPVSDEGTRRRAYRVERWSKAGQVAKGELFRLTVSADQVRQALLWAQIVAGQRRRKPLLLRLAGRDYRTRGVPAKVAMEILHDGPMPILRFVAEALGVPEEQLAADLQQRGYGVKALRVAAALLLATGFCLRPPGSVA